MTDFETNATRAIENSPQRGVTSDLPTCQSIDWYHEGESRVVRVAGIEVTVRYVGRQGRRARLAIVAPAGAAYEEIEVVRATSLIGKS